MWLNFPFKKGKDTFFCIREKDWYSDTKSYDKAVFAQQLSSRSFLREDRMKGTEVHELMAKLLKYLKMWVMLFWEHPLKIIKCDRGRFFLKIEK